MSSETSKPKIFPDPMFWFCEGCRGEGKFDIAGSTTVREAIERLRDLHAKESPKCTDTTRRLRILDAESLQKLKWRITQ